MRKSPLALAALLMLVVVAPMACAKTKTPVAGCFCHSSTCVNSAECGPCCYCVDKQPSYSDVSRGVCVKRGEPEAKPSTALLLALGLTGLAAAKRRRSRH